MYRLHSTFALPMYGASVSVILWIRCPIDKMYSVVRTPDFPMDVVPYPPTRDDDDDALLTLLTAATAAAAALRLLLLLLLLLLLVLLLLVLSPRLCTVCPPLTPAPGFPPAFFLPCCHPAFEPPALPRIAASCRGSSARFMLRSTTTWKSWTRRWHTISSTRLA
jgi:hypothetical protein